MCFLLVCYLQQLQFNIVAVAQGEIMERLPLDVFTRITSFVVRIRLEIGITDKVSGSDAHRLLQRFGPELYENRVRHWAQQMGFPFGPFVIRTIVTQYNWTSILQCVHVDLPSVVCCASVSRMWVKPTAEACTKPAVNTNKAPILCHQHGCFFNWQKSPGMERLTICSAMLSMMRGRPVVQPRLVSS